MGCHRCTKCFRRQIIQLALGYIKKIDWNVYRRNSGVIRMLKIYGYNQSMQYCLIVLRKKGKLPNWVLVYTKALKGEVMEKWIDKYFSINLDNMPEEDREDLLNRLKKFNVELTNPDENEQIKAWHLP